MRVKQFGKKLLKVFAILFGILLVLLIAFHFWFQAHAKKIIEDLVESKSNGKVKLKIEKLRYNYFSRDIRLEKAVFFNTDTLTGTTAYRISIDKVHLQVKAILPFVFRKQILIDSLTLLKPDFQVTRLRFGAKTGEKEKKEVSIPEEMGKVYSSIQDALQILKVKRFQIDDGKFVLINKIDPSQLPLIIGNISFHIDNLKVDEGKLTGNEKLLFSENVVFHSRNQHILFPDGRHRLSFEHFRINLKKRVVEFDSCTIAATRGDSTAASFNVFFNKLKLTNIDFDTLYKSEVIKADSVYCINPRFTLEVNADKRKGSKKSSLKMEKIIQQLTGDMQLGNVVVTNADFNIKTIKNGNPSSFTFSNNNFEMQGLSVIKDAPKLISVKSFTMAIRNYENFIKDSTYNLKFDSVLFKNDRITLSNFHFTKLNNGTILSSFTIPQFSLRGLSWDDLVFDRKLTAEQAIMINPSINYTAQARQSASPKKQTIFHSLGVINEFMNLQQLDIVNGKIDLTLKNNLHLQLDKATVSIKSQSLLESKGLAGINNSLTKLQFEKGNIQSGNIKIWLEDVVYVGKNGQLQASNIKVTNNLKNLSIVLHEVNVVKMQVDEGSGNIFAEGIVWNNGDIKINPPGKKSNGIGSLIDIKNVKGANTSLSGLFGNTAISTLLNSISFSHLEKNGDATIKLESLAVNGGQLHVKNKNLNLSVKDYAITDNEPSIIKTIQYTADKTNISTNLSLPYISFIPHIQPLLNGAIAFDAINVDKPIINISITDKPVTVENKSSMLPTIDITELKLNQPEIKFTQLKDSGKLTLDWHGERNSSNFMLLKDLHTKGNNISLKELNFYLTDLNYHSPKGETFNSGDGKASARISDINIAKSENAPVSWTGNVVHLTTKDLRFDSIGKAKGNLELHSGALKNLIISSTTVTDLQKLVSANKSFDLQNFTGNYTNAKNNLQWHHAEFNRTKNSFSLDSFSFLPALSRDSFIARQIYQTDYLTLRSGSVNINAVDIDNYIKNKTLKIGDAVIDNIYFTDYKDKQFPFNSGIIKKLPVNLLKKIPQKLSINSIQLNNAFIVYSELNEKTKKAGIIPVTKMSIQLLDVKNYNISKTDSLTLQATGYLMDSIHTTLKLKQSYTDTLEGFLMSLQMKPADATILNSALIPLASLKLESGFIDSLNMRVTGREYLAIGEMQLYYHNLKVRLLKNGDESKKTFINGLINLLANSFVIRKNNRSRTGKVFFIRNRDRSFINYLIKIALSGMSSSAGIKSNRKMFKRYKEELEQQPLLPFDMN